MHHRFSRIVALSVSALGLAGCGIVGFGPEAPGDSDILAAVAEDDGALAAVDQLQRHGCALDLEGGDVSLRYNEDLANYVVALRGDCDAAPVHMLRGSVIVVINEGAVVEGVTGFYIERGQWPGNHRFVPLAMSEELVAQPTDLRQWFDNLVLTIGISQLSVARSAPAPALDTGDAIAGGAGPVATDHNGDHEGGTGPCHECVAGYLSAVLTGAALSVETGVGLSGEDLAILETSARIAGNVRCAELPASSDDKYCEEPALCSPWGAFCDVSPGCRLDGGGQEVCDVEYSTCTQTRSGANEGVFACCTGEDGADCSLERNEDSDLSNVFANLYWNPAPEQPEALPESDAATLNGSPCDCDTERFDRACYVGDQGPATQQCVHALGPWCEDSCCWQAVDLNECNPV